MVNHAAQAFSYNRGNHFAYGHLKKNYVKKLHLEAVPPEKPHKENKREDYFEKSVHENKPFKTYTRKDIEKHHQGAKEAERIYSNWQQELADNSADFIHSIKGELKETPETDLETFKEAVSESLEKFLLGLKNDLETVLAESPQGQVKKHLKSADGLLETVRELLWNQIEEIVKEHVPGKPGNQNGESDSSDEIELPVEEINPPVHPPAINPSGNHPVVTLPPNQVFSSGSFKMEVRVGSLTSEIKFADPSKKSEGTTMFHIVDGYGTRKAVDIKFSNETLQKLFEDRIKDSKIYKKEISLERFNAVLKKIEAYMKELCSINPERLKSKVYGEKENLKLENVIDKFTDLFYSLRK
ncbi:hypothetical protein [Fictibacillus arsenicus]|uniref:Uncharacterized protein n=1 Tax=Fictibacillus arsenicus TaxID=255247 RepID=A0A1V3G5M3_9BACL|nr:hypothetical protein [Fictibacillus arsenicus]OOE10022.1 hypothetical protein UN64_16570 [Fictibacillus arsenicus]